ncbi:DUF695 domain-containing protein [Luteimonas sp. MC1825]|uniref:DUF695 domain-containing protein n=1 Tax=Luteimonas sp. MC1825 TaxID=2761107 RepID=UPI00160BC923|nr:DUF695 domain-containing protein [Luteimonas sp. MC1825]MBB6600636.1 DUF695 domain-containing protein [Luteimonas sp. MC1825]QOC88224.1 DUF695 domain-containing protein [Luteimonas sp. MC1825]
MTALEISDEWLVANGYEDDLPLVMRMRASLPPENIRNVYADLAVIYLEFEPDEDGLPSDAMTKELEGAETSLESLIERQGVGIQAASITGNGTREWHYYVSDRQKFKSQLQSALVNYKSFPISIEVCEDPKWNGLADLLESISAGA